MLNDDVADELASLDELGSAELRRRWRELTGEPAPQVSPRLLRLALAYELQAREHGGLSRRAQQVLDQVAGGKTRTRAGQPGMRLMREWNGTLHVVTRQSEPSRSSWGTRTSRTPSGTSASTSMMH